MHRCCAAAEYEETPNSDGGFSWESTCKEHGFGGGVTFGCAVCRAAPSYGPSFVVMNEAATEVRGVVGLCRGCGAKVIARERFGGDGYDIQPYMLEPGKEWGEYTLIPWVSPSAAPGWSMRGSLVCS